MRRAAGVTGRTFLLASAALAAQPAAAFWNDRFEVFADETLTWDSNVFRISKNVDPNQAIGSSSRGDRISVTSLGATMDLPYSLQRFQASYTWFATRYQDFDQLDFNGHNARANWLWAITPHLTGDLGASDQKSLASFSSFRGTARDLVTSRQFYANGTWEVTPSWLLYGGYTHNLRDHDDPLRSVNDVKSDAVEARLSYVTAADNRLGLSYRHEKGKSPEQTILSTLFDNAYTQDSVGVVGRWQVTGLQRLEGRADYVKRDYDQFQDRNYSGPSFRVTHTYVPTGKLTFTTAVYREIAPLDEIQTAFVLLKGVSFRPRWDVTAKIAVLASLDYAKWDYKQGLVPLPPGPGLPIAVGDYSHRVRSGGLTVTWRPYQRVLFQAGYLREVRTSTLENADYEVNIASIEARIGF